MTAPTWTILIASVYARHEQLATLLTGLSRQASAFGGRVNVLVCQDDCELDIGEKRTRLVTAAAGDYVCFVDDDDTVPSNYADRIMGALDERPDYVGFPVTYSVDGRPQKMAFHSLKHDVWWEDAGGYYRGISHLNPIRRDAAVAGLPFPAGFGEDKGWADRVAASGLVRREVFVTQPLYHYAYSTVGSVFRGGALLVGEAPPRPSLPYVEWLP